MPPQTRNKQRKERLLKKVKDDDMKLLDEFAEENKKILAQQDAKTQQDKPQSTSEKEEVADRPLNDISHIKDADEMTKHMKKIYELIITYKQLHPNFEKESDRKKIEIITEKLCLGKIIEEFPIVTRYMICFGHFSEKAFREFLRRCENSKDDPIQMQKRGYRDDKWCQLQADYVTLLWREYNKYRHPSEKERKAVWTQTYQLLKKSFTDMKDKQKIAEKQVKEEKQLFNAENLKDYLERLHEGNQKVSPEDEPKVRLILENIILRGQMRNVFGELKSKIREIEPVCERYGKLPEHEAERRQRSTIRMTETVDAERMTEIPDKYKPEELKGMEMVPVPEEPPILYDENGFEIEEYVELDTTSDSANQSEVTAALQTEMKN